MIEAILKKLNADTAEQRLAALKEITLALQQGKLQYPEKNDRQVNNHIHTTFSFSPYSPTKAVWKAFEAGLTTAGIMDHDSIAGAREFLQAGDMLKMPVTCGLECRVDFSDTPVAGRRLNHPDQKSRAYVALHGVPHQSIDTVQEFFTPLRQARNKRNRLMVERLNNYFAGEGISLDFKDDVLAISEYNQGGTITERHLLFALADKLIDKYGKGETLLHVLEKYFANVLSEKIKKWLLAEDNPYYRYDLLGLLKKDTSYFYVEADEECPPVRDVVELAEETGSILAYAYLGDVEESVTGDKKAQRFEDSYLELLLDVLQELGFHAIAYMPTRNSLQQLRRLKTLCEERDLFQISGEDINSPRQSFVCQALEKEEFDNLIDSTWALIGHEKTASQDLAEAMFSQQTHQKYPDLAERVQVYKELGQQDF